MDKNILKQKSLVIIIVFSAAFCFFLMHYVSGLIKKPAEVLIVKIGYFYGGRTNMLYRTYLYRYFEDIGVNVKLYTRNLRDNSLFEVPKKHNIIGEIKKEVGDESFGKISGVEVIDYIVDGHFHGGAVGESSFIEAVNKGDPIVAVAMLGHDSIKSPGKAIILRKGLVIKSPQDFKGKTLISRRAGPGDPIFLREFLRSIGMADEKSIKIIDGVYEDQIGPLLAEGKIDGGLYHLKALIEIVEKGTAYVFRPMDWMNPELSHALLIFRKDFVDKHPDLVQKVVSAYVKRIHYEKSLPEHQIEKSRDKGLTMRLEFMGMCIPQYDMPPYVRADLLNDMQDLFIKYGHLKKGARIEDFIDNSFVERAVKDIKVLEKK